jgi:hypothetical protein
MAAMPARIVAALGFVLILIPGCYSPYAADRGALLGGAGGAGVGALVGQAAGGHPVVGALVGAGVGAASGAAVGGSLDQIQANNRAQIEARLGHPVRAGAVNVGDVVNMSRAGVADDLMINYVRTNGMAAPLQSNDLILLQQQGVSPRVVQAMQTPPAVGQPVIVPPGPQPVMYAAPPPYWGPAYYRAWRPASGGAAAD